VLEGVPRINAALDLATAECRTEVLTVQPGGGRDEDSLSRSLERGLSVVHRGVRIRTLYQHTARHSQSTLAYAERIADDNVEIRTLEELIERLIVFDRKVAFIPAQDDRQVALELRHPGLVEYLAKVFEQLWTRAAPLLE
nr:helix-turn-helix transcriptional regulator [Streptomyces sp. DSM 41633]